MFNFNVKNFIWILSFCCLFKQRLTTNILPPIPEEWLIEIESVEFGIKNTHWLKDYTFYAPSAVKPGSNWNAYIEAIWTGPEIVEANHQKYISLVFTPLEQSANSDWSGDKFLEVSSFDAATNKIVFRPKNNKTFMIAPESKIGVYNGMHFNLAISTRLIPGMNVMINTRIFRDVEVTCSDGLFCNGEERFVNGKCVKVNTNPCEDASGNLCASFECIESEKQCSKIPKGGSDCPKCFGDKPGDIVTCSGIGYECGWTYDKTLFCGNCSDGYVCSKGNCILASSVSKGTCENPHQLLNSSLIIPEEGISNLTIYGDLGEPNLIDSVLPICHYTAVPDIVYVFRIESKVKMGMEVQMLAADGTIDILDTLLALTDEQCAALPIFSFCGDDSSPPGGLSSRVFGKLTNGTYKLIASATKIKNLGPFKLLIKFYPNCVPQCDGNRKCGSDGCGGVCGTCLDGQECHLKSGKCRDKECKPDCFFRIGNASSLKECGDDGCGGVCGSCSLEKFEMCSSQISTCKKIKPCDSLKPSCDSKPPISLKSPFCASDCKWHDIKESLGDLTPNGRDEVIPSIEFEWQFVSNRSCSLIEGCFRFTGYRLVMRFDTYVHNIGRESFVPPNPEDAPDKFEFSPCHAHYHFEGFASFNLYDMNSKLAAIGGKRGYCIEDSIQTTFGSHISCKKRFSCEKQGIQPGFADLYRKDLDCQWIDITDIQKDTWYIYEVCTNTQRKLVEASFSNNCKRFSVYVPNIDNNNSGIVIKYKDVLKERNITSEPVLFIDPDTLFEKEPWKEQKEKGMFQTLLNIFSYLFSFIF